MTLAADARLRGRDRHAEGAGLAVEVDVAVVGGGPAGAAASYYLARQGRSVLVVEQKAFPRDKACGDGLTPRAVRMLVDMGLGDRFGDWRRVQGVRVRAAATTRTARMPPTRQWCDFGLVVPRRVLDATVLDNAAAAGATVRYNTRALRPVVERGRVRGLVIRAGAREETVSAAWVVCAEGSTGRVLRALGRTHDLHYPVGLALRQYSPAGSLQLDWFDVYVDLRKNGALLPGYGWAFPGVGGAVNVGVGLLNTAHGWNRVSLHGHLDRFVARLERDGVLAPGAPVGRRGGRLFMGGSVWPPHGPGYVLVGDAAGMINPATGEGIAYAYETGRTAARHVHAAMDCGAQSVPEYTREVERHYGDYHRLGRGLVTMIADPERMERLVTRAMVSDRRLRFALGLLFNLHDASLRPLDQYGARGLVWLARATGWDPRPPNAAVISHPALHRR
ncbi:MAG TPA: geranylgeranyl reductase family protein [Egibacteraceae bacterium]|nr:geranylgeranyl reductase family protein [Egibacteraceae bacterium]